MFLNISLNVGEIVGEVLSLLHQHLPTKVMKKVSTTFVLDTTKPHANDKFAIRLRIIYNREKRMYQTGFSCTLEEWEKANSPKPRNEFKALKMQLMEFEKKAIEAIQLIKPFSFDVFKEVMYPKETTATTNTLKSYFEKYVKKLRQENRIKTALTYENALTSLLKFNKNLDFKDITPEFLKKYEQHEVNKGNSLTSVGFNLRNLRAILNLAVREKILSVENYPFGKNRYTIPKGQNIKKALTTIELKRFLQYEPTTPSEIFAKDMFLFSFYCNGINMKDIALLKWKDIDNDKIVFIRAKTANTSKASKPISVFLNSKVMDILNRQGCKDAEPNDFVFPILQPFYSPEKSVQVISQTIKNINAGLKKIGKNIGLTKHLTTYVARHSFATFLKRSNISTEMISEALGHTSLNTTENYLDSFEDDTKKGIANLLLEI